MKSTREWTVTEFDENTLFGTVKYEVYGTEARTLRFHSTCFMSDRCFRWPRVGERVEVVFNRNGELLSVHGE